MSYPITGNVSLGNIPGNIKLFVNDSGSSNLTGFGYNNNCMTFSVNQSVTDTPEVVINQFGNVGIGTSTPNGALHIFEPTGTGDSGGSSSGSLVIEHGNPGGVSSIIFPSSTNRINDFGYIRYRDDISNNTTNERGRLEIGTENDNGIYPSVVDSLILQKNGGRVGIGTTNPQFTLDVNGSIRSTDVNAYGGINTTGGILLNSATNFGTNNITFSNGTSSFSLQVNDTVSPNVLRFITGGTSALVIATTANVGIRTTSPQYPLDVNGTIRSTDVRIDNGNIHLGQNAGLTNQGTNAIAIGSNAGQTNQGTNSIAIGSNSSGTGTNSVAIGINATTSTYNNSVALGTGATSTADNQIRLGTANQYVSILGSVGIGIQTPAYPLDVSGTVFINNNSAFTSYVHFNGSAPGIRLNNNKVLGLVAGSFIPYSSFGTVVGNYSYLNTYVYRHTTTGSANNGWQSSSTRIQQMIDNTNQAYIEFNPPNAQQGIGIYGGASTESYGTGKGITVKSDGSVGIGTTNPTKPLEILGASGGLLKLVNSTSAYEGGQSNIEFWNNNSNYRLGQISAIDTSPGDTYRSVLALSASYHTDGFVEGMRIVAQSPSSAFVGIGTTNPQQTLQVNGNIILSGMTNGFQQPGSRFIGLGSLNGAVGIDGFTGMEIQSVNANGNYSQNIRFWTHHHAASTGGTPRMTIQYNGNVGIGTTNPVSPLHVFRSTSGTLASFIGNGIGGNNYNFDFCAYLSSGGIPTNRIACIDDGNFSGHYAFYSKTPGADTNPLVERMRISSNGFIGIPQLLTTNENLVSIDCVNSAAVDALGCRSQSDGNNIINFYNTAGALKGHVGSSNSSSVSYNSGSDRRLKENITDMGSMINKIKQLKPRHFNWISGGEKDDGFIAQELFNVLPQLRPINAFKCKTISHNEKYDGKVCSCCDLENPKRNSNGAPYIYGVDYGKLTPYLVKAIQEQQTQIEQLENTIKSQQSQIDMLLKRLENAGF